MSIETRHTEKSILFQLLKAKTIEDYETVTQSLIATMEPEDAELVQKRVSELDSKRKNK